MPTSCRTSATKCCRGWSGRDCANGSDAHARPDLAAAQRCVFLGPKSHPPIQSYSQVYDLSADVPPRCLHAGDGDRQLEAARPGAPRIEKQDAVTRFDRGTMGMPEHHRRKDSRHGIDVELSDVMQHEEPMVADFDKFGRGQRPSPASLV